MVEKPDRRKRSDLVVRRLDLDRAETIIRVPGRERAIELIGRLKDDPETWSVTVFSPGLHQRCLFYYFRSSDLVYDLDRRKPPVVDPGLTPS